MTTFRILKFIRSAQGGGSEFLIECMEGKVMAGETFEVYEAGHWWVVAIASATHYSNSGVLRTVYEIGYDDQYNGAVVSTDRARGPGRFRYEHS
jgi:hypothetical protein